MGTTLEDIYYEQHLEELQRAEEIEREVEKFKKENLKRFYLDQSNVYKEILETLEIAQSLIKNNFPVPAFVFYSICLELTIKNLFIYPFVYGYLLDDEIAEIIIAEIFRTSVSRFDKLVLYISKEFGDIDLKKGDTSLKITPWIEAKRLRNIRNEIVHKGIKSSGRDLNKIVKLTNFFLERLVSEVFDKVGVKINNKNIIVDK